MDAERPRLQPEATANRAQDCRQTCRKVTDEAKQNACDVAITRAADVSQAPGIAPPKSDEGDSKIEREGVGRIPNSNLAEDRRGGGLEEGEGQVLFKEIGGDLWITLKPERGEGV